MINKILDYEQAKDKLLELVSKGTIQKQMDLGTTKYGLPIEHYTLGEGQKEVVITGATHGSEIISTDFVIQLMEYLQSNKNINLKEYKFHFIPMLNPEGYLITTSAIRKLIPREMSSEEAEKICHSYYEAYKNDDMNMISRKKQGLKVDRTTVKRHQLFFEGINYDCIPDEFSELKQSVKTILEKYADLPENCLQIWSANGDGIDIQANCKYNPVIKNIEDGEKIYKDDLRHSNIDISHPGPINCPYDKDKGFTEIPEKRAIEGLLKELNSKGTLTAYYNYHGTGGLLFQRLPEVPDGLEIDNQDFWKANLTNYLLSRSYEEKCKYKILKGSSKVTSSNDVFRVQYPQNMLIELSKMGGNPIGPYGDIKNNYNNVISSNIESFIYSIKLNELTQKISNEASIIIKDRLKYENLDDNMDKIYEIMDLIYEEFSIKVNKLEGVSENKNEKGFER